MRSRLASVYREVQLDPVRFAGSRRVSRFMLENARTNAYLDHLTADLIIEVAGQVYAEKVGRVHHIVEEPVWPSWRHQLLASLPEDGFRQRFLRFFWGIEDWRPKRIKHTVTANAYRAYPDATVRVHQEWGGPVIFSTLDDYTRDYEGA